MIKLRVSPHIHCSKPYHAASLLTLKIAIFKIHIEDVHCKHVILGGSADNGYARLLGPYSDDKAIRKRITMLEGPPFAQELSALVGKFNQCSFSEIFRDTKIPPRRVSFSATPPKSTSPKPTYSAAISTPMDSKASSAKESPPKPEGGIFRNNQGQRVDRPIKVNRTLVNRMKQRKLCNHHHLAGDCSFIGCKHEHAKNLNGTELDALRCVARLAPCEFGLQCDDEYCFAGHRCTFENCKGAQQADCKFPAEMHYVDTKIVEY